MTFAAKEANAVVCARGVYRAGCAGPNAAVVVRKPVPVARCTRVLVNGVYVKRCVCPRVVNPARFGYDSHLAVSDRRKRVSGSGLRRATPCR